MMLSAVPHRIEPSRNSAMPKMKNRLRPYISDSLPKIGIPAISVTRYAEVTQTNWSIPPRSDTMVAMAVATMVLSMAATNMPSNRPVRTSPSLLCT
ncbi:hypothetical protein D3C75_751530 [compost metagenome]